MTCSIMFKEFNLFKNTRILEITIRVENALGHVRSATPRNQFHQNLMV